MEDKLYICKYDKAFNRCFLIIKYIQINLSYGLNDYKLNRIYKMMDKDGKNYVNNFIIYELNMDRYMKFWYNRDKKKIIEK